MAVDQIFINKTNLLVQLVDLKHCGDNLNYQTKSKTKGLFDIQFFNTQIHGSQSAKSNCIKD